MFFLNPRALKEETDGPNLDTSNVWILGYASLYVLHLPLIPNSIRLFFFSLMNTIWVWVLLYSGGTPTTRLLGHCVRLAKPN